MCGSICNKDNLKRGGGEATGQEVGPDLKSKEIRAWLHKSAHNYALNWKRTITRRQRHEAVSLNAPDADSIVSYSLANSNDSPLGGLLLSEQRDKVRAILARLEPRHRDLLWRHHGLGESIAEIAAIYGEDANSTRQALHRARKRFAPLYGVEPES